MKNLIIVLLPEEHISACYLFFCYILFSSKEKKRQKKKGTSKVLKEGK